MKFTVALLLFAAAAAFVHAAEDPTEKLDGVLDLTPDDFEKHVNGAKHALVEFYAPWCGHCKHLTPEYKALGAQVAADPKLKNRVVIAKVDADAHRDLGEKYGIKGFPTIKWFKRGAPATSPDDYNGGRTAADFLAHIKTELDNDSGFARVEILDPLAKEFLEAADKSAAAKALADKVSTLVEAAEKSAGDLYVKFAKKAVEKGTEYFATETARLERMLASGSVGGAKLEEISQKLSVLTAFHPEEPESADA